MAFFVYVQQQSLRKQIKQKYLEGFVGDELIFLAIPVEFESEPNNSFRRIHSKEFVYLGQMYDIVEQQRIDGIIWYLVYPDKKETMLKQKMKLLMADYDRESQKQHQTSKTIKPLLFLEQTGFEFAGIIASIKDCFDVVYFFSIIDWLEQPLAPPPRIS